MTAITHVHARQLLDSRGNPALEVDVRLLLEARKQLANLITYMDGKSGAEDLVSKLLQDPALLQTLAATKNPQGETS